MPFAAPRAPGYDRTMMVHRSEPAAGGADAAVEWPPADSAWRPGLSAVLCTALLSGALAVAACGTSASAPALPSVADRGPSWPPPETTWVIEAGSRQSLRSTAIACALYVTAQACDRIDAALALAPREGVTPIGVAQLDGEAEAQVVWLGTSPQRYAAEHLADRPRTTSGEATLVAGDAAVYVLRDDDVVIVTTPVASVRERWAVWFAAQPSISGARPAASTVRFRVAATRATQWAQTTSLAMIAGALGEISGELSMSPMDVHATFHVQASPELLQVFSGTTDGKLPAAAERMPAMLVNARLDAAALGRVITTHVSEQARAQIEPFIANASGAFGIVSFADGRIDARIGARSQEDAAILSERLSEEVPFVTWTHLGALVAGSTGSAFAAALPESASSASPRRYPELVAKTASPAAVLALLYRRGLAPAVDSPLARPGVPTLVLDNPDVPRTEAFDAAVADYERATAALANADEAYDRLLVAATAFNAGDAPILDGVVAVQLRAAAPVHGSLELTIDYLGESRPLGPSLEALASERDRLAVAASEAGAARQQAFAVAQKAYAAALSIRTRDVVSWDQTHGP